MVTKSTFLKMTAWLLILVMSWSVMPLSALAGEAPLPGAGSEDDAYAEEGFIADDSIPSEETGGEEPGTVEAGNGEENTGEADTEEPIDGSATDVDGVQGYGEYSAGDIAAVNAIIAGNRLRLPEWDEGASPPAQWDKHIVWSVPRPEKRVVEMDLSSLGLSRLEINALTELEALRCADNDLEKLDLSALGKLRYLDCGGNPLELLQFYGSRDFLLAANPADGGAVSVETVSIDNGVSGQSRQDDEPFSVSLSLSASPNAGFEFTGWLYPDSSAASTDNPISLKLQNSTTTLAANFADTADSDETSASGNGGIDDTDGDGEPEADEDGSETPADGNETPGVAPPVPDGTENADSIISSIDSYIPVVSVAIDRDAVTLTAAGKTVLLQAFISPENATEGGVTWTSSDPLVAAVDDDGLVTAVSKSGSATITATAAGGESADCVVYIGKAVSKISLKHKTRTLRLGSSFALVATLSPSGAANKTVTWVSSDAEVASVSDSGVVTANAQGTATITVTTQDGGKVSSCVITVKPPVDGIELDAPHKNTMRVGSSFKLKATVSPDNAFDKTVTWGSSDTKVATVDKNGKVKAKAAGTVAITCTSKDNAECSAAVVITVKPKVKNVKLSASSITSLPGHVYEIGATVNPSDAYNLDVKWKSSKPKVATVDENGVITTIAAGKAVIKCTSVDNSKASAKVTVNVKLPVSGLKLNVSSRSVAQGSTYTLKATVSPSSAIDKSVTWESSDTSVATVDSKGKVKGVSTGTAVITCTSAYDGGFAAQATITVPPTISLSNAKRGIDVSNWQGNIDWAAVKKSGKVDFVIIRGLAWDNAINNYKVDDRFVQNVRGARAQGIPVGAYIFCYSTTVPHLQAAVDFLHTTVKNNGLSLQLPIFIDFEWSGNINNGSTYAERTKLVEEGMKRIKSHGYQAGFYSNLNWARNYYDAQALESKGYAFWLANWKSPNTPNRSPSESNGWHKLPSFWQYTSVGSVPGISGNVDMNFCYSSAYFK